MVRRISVDPGVDHVPKDAKLDAQTLQRRKQPNKLAVIELTSMNYGPAFEGACVWGVCVCVCTGCV